MHTWVHQKLCIGIFIGFIIFPNRQKLETSQMPINIDDYITGMGYYINFIHHLVLISPSAIHYCPKEARHKNTVHHEYNYKVQNRQK